MMKRTLLLFALLPCLASAQDRSLIVAGFESAAAEFNVPADVLKGISFAETRWFHVEYADGDTVSCVGLPHVYGVMALRDDAFFGRSLRESAALIGRNPADLKTDPIQNIRGAAAFLRKLYDAAPVPANTTRGSLESWQNAIMSYCGIPQRELAAQHAFEIYTRLAKGYNDFGIRLQPRTFNLNVVRANTQAIYAEAIRASGLRKATATPDYPLAHWVSANPGNWYTSGYGRFFVVIHDMEGYYLSVIAMFADPNHTSSSIHYDINGLQDSPSDAPAGDITQQVEEQYWAWHAICMNKYSFGIEHEGFVANPVYFSPEMYLASAKLTRWLCDRYSIPMDRNHIVGHDEWQNSSWVNWAVANGYPSTFGTCNTHTDPGQYWDWDFLMQMIRQDTTAPHVTATPTQLVKALGPLSVTFDQRMEPASLISKFQLTPSVDGTFSWSNINRTLNFTPTSAFAFGTTYSAKIDTGSHNYLNVLLDSNNDGTADGNAYTFTFTTEARDTIPPVITTTYPADHQSDASTAVVLNIDFNEPIQVGTAIGGITLQDSLGGSLGLTGYSVAALGSGMRLRVRPTANLLPNAPYTATVLTSILDVSGNGMSAPQPFSFRTEVPPTMDGTIIDAMDVMGNWKAPSYSGSTKNVTASWAITTGIKKNGSAGQLTYTFTQTTGGVIREYNSGEPSIEGGTLLGCWVYGDNSGNELRYAAYYWDATSTKTYFEVPVGIINWTGWKLKTVPLSAVPVGNGTPRTFAGLLVYQKSGALVGGTLYFDELRVGNTVTGIADPSPSMIPDRITLHPCYPNPFNPATTVQFDLPAAANVRLSVFDLLGREVDLLRNGPASAGSNVVRWDASAFPSGTYFVRLQSAHQTRTTKVLLVR